ncbi:MAG: EamA family transporter, partial [Planctomycetota bacterium]
LFTALIPLHVVLVESAWKRRIEPRALGGAVLALAGAAVLAWQLPRGTGIWRAFLLVQAANLCFAAGQVVYRRLHARVPLDHKSAHALAFLGAVAVALPACLIWGEPIQTARALDGPALASLLYLGLVASGLGFLFWNRGATRVRLGTLAVFNNVKAPLAVLVGLTVFGEVPRDPERLTAGALLIAAGLAFTLVGRRPRTSPPR